MAFEDLARHIASRDGKRKLIERARNAEQLVAELGEEDRRRRARASDPRRELVLGSLLAIVGLAGAALYIVYIVRETGLGFGESSPKHSMIIYSSAFLAAAVGAVIVGIQRTVRAIRAVRAPPPIAPAIVVERAP